ncbi:hypothetical protein CAP35_12915 [Chitinophagaceae bacterium IBVUCB1]|nr:hypothetical protein CAP35_12915 [Chitinophagaceae bacterium IBVUCB1]
MADEQQVSADVDTDALLATIQDNMSTTLRPTLEEQLKPVIESNYLGRFSGTLRSALNRAFGFKNKELEKMSIEQMVNKCRELVDGYINQTDAEKQTAIETAINGYEAQLQQIKDNYEAMLATERGKQTQRDVTTRCIALLERLPRKGGDITEQADMLRHKMQTAYDVRYNSDGNKLEFYKEDKPVLADDNQPMSDERFARMWAEKAGILVNDTRHISPADVKAGHSGGYGSGVIIAQSSPNDAMEAIVAWAEQ